MEYRSQKIAYWYFAAALPLFVLQVLVGLWLAANYTFTIPQSIVNVFPFSTARAIHTNLLVLWMLLGFMEAPTTSSPRRRSPSSTPPASPGSS